MNDETTYTATLKVQWKGQPTLPEKLTDMVILEMTNLTMVYTDCPVCLGKGVNSVGKSCRICEIKSKGGYIP